MAGARATRWPPASRAACSEAARPAPSPTISQRPAATRAAGSAEGSQRTLIIHPSSRRLASSWPRRWKTKPVTPPTAAPDASTRTMSATQRSALRSVLGDRRAAPHGAAPVRALDAARDAERVDAGRHPRRARADGRGGHLEDPVEHRRVHVERARRAGRLGELHLADGDRSGRRRCLAARVRAPQLDDALERGAVLDARLALRAIEARRVDLRAASRLHAARSAFAAASRRRAHDAARVDGPRRVRRVPGSRRDLQAPAVALDARHHLHGHLRPRVERQELQELEGRELDLRPGERLRARREHHLDVAGAGEDRGALHAVIASQAARRTDGRLPDPRRPRESRGASAVRAAGDRRSPREAADEGAGSGSGSQWRSRCQGYFGSARRRADSGKSFAGSSDMALRGASRRAPRGASRRSGCSRRSEPRDDAAARRRLACAVSTAETSTGCGLILEEDGVAVLPERLGGGAELDAVAEVPGPVARSELGPLEHLSGDGRAHRDGRLARREGGEARLVVLDERLHHRAVAGDVGVDAPAEDAARLELREQLVDRARLAGQHARAAAVGDADADLVFEARNLLLRVLQRKLHQRHRPRPGQPLEQRAANHDRARRVLQRQRPGRVRRGRPRPCCGRRRRAARRPTSARAPPGPPGSRTAPAARRRSSRAATPTGTRAARRRPTSRSARG